MIPYGRQNISSADIKEVCKILKSDYLTQGPTVEIFENLISEYCDVKFVTAVNSATSALHLACLAVGLSQNDILWTSPNSFVASANCGLYCGAKVDFVDIDKTTRNIDIDRLEEKLILAEKTGSLPKVVVAVHFAGFSCEMKRIRKLAQRYNFKIIEDASHAIGGEYLNAKVGSCRFSDVTVFSFHPVKIVTTGEGGALTTNDPELDEKIKLLRSHGVTRDAKLIGFDPDPWYYEQKLLGYNYRMTDIQAALGCSQLQKLDKFINKRIKIANNYFAELMNSDLTLPFLSDYNKSAWHLFVINLPKGSPRRQLFIELRKMGIGVNVHYIPIYSQPYFNKIGYNKKEFPNCEDYYKTALTIPLFPDLHQNDQNFIIEKLKTLVSSKF